MSMSGLCGGCGVEVADGCANSLAAAGARTVHWECWSHCNLRCGFCYRTLGEPLNPGDAIRLLRILKAGGAETVVFTGGDPALRADLGELVAQVRDLDLVPIIHTNAHALGTSTWDAMALCDHVGLSLDAPDPEIHDTMRGRRGNHARVVETLRRCSDLGLDVHVRSVVSAMNWHVVHKLGPFLAGYPCVRSWRLLEFTPVELGWQNRATHTVSAEHLEETYQRAVAEYADVDLLRTADKIDAYMMISPHGRAYGVTENHSISTGRHHYVGSLLVDHLAEIACRLVISPSSHAQRRRFASS
jgi:MoaA/NifB/PqqE/SkfB family radical SAM enzyme